MGKWHDRGEQDARKGLQVRENGPGMLADKEAFKDYDAGYFHTRGQIDRASGKGRKDPYFIPLGGQDEARNAAYDKGYKGK